jgi:Escherichia/Staphylococcus phage prohead protease
MPIPRPKRNESQTDYMGRCMHAIRDEFTSQDQRVAVCLRTFRDHGKEDEVIEQLSTIAEKFNPNHDARGRFTGGGGSTVAGGGRGGSRGRGAVFPVSGRILHGEILGAAEKDPFTAHWRAQSDTLGNLANLATLGVVSFTAIIAGLIIRKGVNYIRKAMRKPEEGDGKQASDAAQQIVEEILAMPKDKRLEALNEMLGGLSDEDAQFVYDHATEKSAMSDDLKGNPNHDPRTGRFTSGSGGGASSGSSGGGGAAPKQPKPEPSPFSREWYDHWKVLGNTYVRIALALAFVAAPQIVLKAIAALIKIKGGAYVAHSFFQYKQVTVHNNAQMLTDEILKLPRDKQGQVFTALLSGLSSQEAEQVSALVPDVPKAEPFRAFEEAIAMLRKDSSTNKPYGDVEYADPGYQADGKRRYPVDTEGHIRAAWNYINHPDNQKPYTSEQLAKVRSRIIAAWKKRIDPAGPPSASKEHVMFETKDFDLEVKGVSDKGTFEGYASTFGNVDLGGDKMMPGAFAKTLAEHKSRGTSPLMLWSHDPRSPIGVWKEMLEDASGLYVKGDLLIDQKVPSADMVHSLLKAKAVRGLSIGYRVKEAEPEENIRLLKAVDLKEVSVVGMPMNQRARVDTVKSDQCIEHWAWFEDWARRLRDGEMPPIKELEDILREAGVPKSLALQIASVGYAKTIRRSDSGDDEATDDALTRLKSALKRFA